MLPRPRSTPAAREQTDGDPAPGRSRFAGKRPRRAKPRSAPRRDRRRMGSGRRFRAHSRGCRAAAAWLRPAARADREPPGRRPPIDRPAARIAANAPRFHRIEVGAGHFGGMVARRSCWQAEVPAPQDTQALAYQYGTDAFVCQPAARLQTVPRPHRRMVPRAAAASRRIRDGARTSPARSSLAVPSRRSGSVARRKARLAPAWKPGIRLAGNSRKETGKSSPKWDRPPGARRGIRAAGSRAARPAAGPQ